MEKADSKIKKYCIKVALFLLKGLILIKKISCFLFFLLKIFFSFFFKLLLRSGGKRVILFIYQTYLFIKRLANKSFLPAKNKFFYPFINKETIHFVVILLSLSVCAENVRTKMGNAQSTDELLSRGSIISQFATEELGDSVLIEEKVSIDGETVKNEQSDYININSFAVKQGGQIGTSSDEFAEEFLNARILAHSEGLVKPDITSTTSAQESKTPERKEIQEYIVQAGDIIGSIATKFSITVNTILWSNNLSFYSIIRPGDKLKILPVSGVLHKVAYGETLGAIANKYNADLEKIKEYNTLANANSLQKGQELIIPDGVIRAAPRVAASRTSPYSAPIASSKAQYSSSANFVWPTTSKRITQYYHWGHHAIDVGGKTGTPIYSIEKGQIIFSGWSSGYGKNIIIDHGGGQKSRYAHFSSLYVKKGALVDKGQQIGEMGSTGWSTGSHLHLEIIINGVKVNPLKYVR